MYKNSNLAVFGLLLAYAPAWAVGGPPLMTDDPGTPGDGNWEVNVAVTSEISRVERRFETPITDINYGFGERTQLKYEVPFVISQNLQESSSISAVDRSMGGVKYRILDREDSGFAMSTYPQIVFNTPVRSALQDADEAPGTEYLLPIELEQARGNWEFNQELGYHIIPRAKNQAFYGAAFTYNIRDGLSILSELHGSALQDLSDDELVMNLGGQVEIKKNLTLLVSAGRSLHDFEDGPPRYLSYAGLQFKM